MRISKKTGKLMRRYVQRKQADVPITSTSKDPEAILHSPVFLKNQSTLIDFVEAYAMRSIMPGESCDTYHLPTLTPPNSLVDERINLPPTGNKGKRKIGHSGGSHHQSQNHSDVSSSTGNTGRRNHHEAGPSKRGRSQRRR